MCPTITSSLPSPSMSATTGELNVMPCVYLGHPDTSEPSRLKTWITPVLL
jgi:hypothetical protein